MSSASQDAACLCSSKMGPRGVHGAHRRARRPLLPSAPYPHPRNSHVAGGEHIPCLCGH